jgi:hypothetical protein
MLVIYYTVQVTPHNASDTVVSHLISSHLMWSQQVHDLSLSLSSFLSYVIILSFVHYISCSSSFIISLSLSLSLFHTLSLSSSLSFISYHIIKLHSILSLSPPITSSAPHHFFRLHFPLLIDYNTVCQCVSTLHTHVVPRTLILDMKSVFL